MVNPFSNGDLIRLIKAPPLSTTTAFWLHLVGAKLHVCLLQFFQRDPNAPQPPKVENPAKGDGGGFKLPSFSAPSFSAPSLPNLPAGPKEVAGGIDARTIALPGA